MPYWKQYDTNCSKLVFYQWNERWECRKNVPRAAFVGKREVFHRFEYFLDKTTIRMNPIGYIYMDEEMQEEDISDEYLGGVSDLENLIREHKIDSPGQILFRQTRVGQNGRLFKCK